MLSLRICYKFCRAQPKKRASSVTAKLICCCKTRSAKSTFAAENLCLRHMIAQLWKRALTPQVTFVTVVSSQLQVLQSSAKMTRQFCNCKVDFVNVMLQNSRFCSHRKLIFSSCNTPAFAAIKVKLPQQTARLQL